MTAATATPQVMRDRLLQAIDAQSNQICNMVIVMEVVSFLEKYPITKEALEETRLGKLINDVRKKTKNEDLARRAKKLLRNWQKLIEPGKVDPLSKVHPVTTWSSNCGAHPCIPISAPAALTSSGKTGPELKNRNDFNNCSSPRVEKLSDRKHKSDHKDGQLLPAKTSKVMRNENGKQLLTNGIGCSSEILTDTCAHQSFSRDAPEPLENDRLNKIPVNAVKPHPSALGYSKPLSTSYLLKASVLQQQARQEQAASGGQYRPRSPHDSLHSPQTTKPEVGVKQTAKGQSLSSSSLKPVSVDNSAVGSCPRSFFVGVQDLHPDGTRSTDLDPPSTSIPTSHDLPCSSGVSLEDGGIAISTCKRKGQKCKSKDLDVPTVEGSVKPVRLKDRRLTFDPITGQIKPSLHKEGAVRPDHKPEIQWSEQSKQNPPLPPSPFQQTDWKELSRSEIIQSYLSQQSNVLTSSGAHTSSAHLFMTEFLNKEEHRSKDVEQTHCLAPELPALQDLPGVGREIVSEDLSRLHTRHWSGVNGCYDTKGSWFDWTECISLDPHGDESRLNILPYVCLD
ncbi:mediator of RNA polymerase II transcription subunit 26-like [Brachionichthys hirsutus]|uniref:mediator of RNA polymerase II transcription subunit 26-like n=1 Tax=Brachionichthys hirsutus TaxID=412623 RepID=UPI003604EC3D